MSPVRRDTHGRWHPSPASTRTVRRPDVRSSLAVCAGTPLRARAHLRDSSCVAAPSHLLHSTPTPTPPTTPTPTPPARARLPHSRPFAHRPPATPHTRADCCATPPHVSACFVAAISRDSRHCVSGWYAFIAGPHSWSYLASPCHLGLPNNRPQPARARARAHGARRAREAQASAGSLLGARGHDPARP
eukprot:7385227-Prymnesium_polylepis.1